MAEQFELPGFASAPEAGQSHSLFFAILPDAATAARIMPIAEELRARHGLPEKLLAARRLHVTLLEVWPTRPLPPPPSLKESARRAAADVLSAPFDIVFDRALRFSGSGAFVLGSGGDDGIAALKTFRQRLIAELAKHGIRVPRSSFTPHMTLLYTDRHVAQHPTDPLRWTAADFALVHSHVGETRHELVGRWPRRG